jgi:hypothetical protein
MVEDQAVILTYPSPKASAYDLDVQNLGLGRPSEDDAPDIPVNPSR